MPAQLFPQCVHSFRRTDAIYGHLQMSFQALYISINSIDHTWFVGSFLSIVTQISNILLRLLSPSLHTCFRNLMETRFYPDFHKLLKNKQGLITSEHY